MKSTDALQVGFLSLLTIINKGLSLMIVHEGASLTIVNKGLSLTIVNEGLWLTIVNKTTSFIKMIVSFLIFCRRFHNKRSLFHKKE